MTTEEYQKLVQTAKQRLVDEIDTSSDPAARAEAMKNSYLLIDRLAAQMYFNRRTG